MRALHLDSLLTTLVQAWKAARPVDGKLPPGNDAVVANWWDVLNTELLLRTGD